MCSPSPLFPDGYLLSGMYPLGGVTKRVPGGERRRSTPENRSVPPQDLQGPLRSVRGGAGQRRLTFQKEGGTMKATWRLRMAAAERGVWTGADLKRLLHERAGLRLSAASI